VLVASRRSIVAFWLVLALARQASAQELCLLESPPIDLSPEPLTASDQNHDDTLEISARRIGVGADSAAEFSDEVQMRYRDCAVTAQSAILAGGNVDVLGRVNVACPDVTVYGDDAHYDTEVVVTKWEELLARVADARRGRRRRPRSGQ